MPEKYPEEVAVLDRDIEISYSQKTEPGLTSLECIDDKVLTIPESHNKYDVESITKELLIRRCDFFAAIAKENRNKADLMAEKTITSIKQGDIMRQNGLSEKEIREQKIAAMRNRHNENRKLIISDNKDKQLTPKSESANKLQEEPLLDKQVQYSEQSSVITVDEIMRNSFAEEQIDIQQVILKLNNPGVNVDPPTSSPIKKRYIYNNQDQTKSNSDEVADNSNIANEITVEEFKESQLDISIPEVDAELWVDFQEPNSDLRSHNIYQDQDQNDSQLQLRYESFDLNEAVQIEDFDQQTPFISIENLFDVEYFEDESVITEAIEVYKEILILNFTDHLISDQENNSPDSEIDFSSNYIEIDISADEDVKELLAKDIDLAEVMTLTNIKDKATDQPLEDTLAMLSSLIQEYPDNITEQEFIQLDNIFTELEATFQAHYIEQNENELVLDITPELTQKILLFLHYLGYDKPKDILIDMIQKYGLVSLIQALRYMYQLISKGVRKEFNQFTYYFTNNDLSIYIGRIIFILISGLNFLFAQTLKIDA